MRFWISWYEPGNDPRPAREWKTAPPWWCTGTSLMSDDSVQSVICAVVDAKTEAAARKIVKRLWDPAEWRFCEVHEAEWMPPAGRFPPREAA
jgi:hypothetical protein